MFFFAPAQVAVEAIGTERGTREWGDHRREEGGGGGDDRGNEVGKGAGGRVLLISTGTYPCYKTPQPFFWYCIFYTCRGCLYIQSLCRNVLVRGMMS